jgi:outer membrane protein
MKIKVNSIILVFIFLFISVQKSVAEDLNIVFVDMDKIIASSNAGKKIQSSIDKFAKKENQKFDSTESNLKKKEQEILKQKNIISKEELDKKVKSFQTELSKLRKEKIEFNRNIIKKNKDATNKMVNEINKILTQYASDNSVSLVIQKKNIIIGKTELDITPQILKVFNSKVKSID